MKLEIKVNGKLDTKRMLLYSIQDKAKQLYDTHMPRVDEFFTTQGGTR